MLSFVLRVFLISLFSSSPTTLLFSLENQEHSGQDVKLTIKPVLVSSELVITNLDSVLECKMYDAYGFLPHLDCFEEETIRTFALLYLLRKKFERFIGMHEEIAKKILDGRWGELEAEMKQGMEKFKEFFLIGYSERNISDELKNVLLFSEKVKDMVGADITLVFESLRIYVVHRERSGISHDPASEQKLNDRMTEMIQSFIGSFLPSDLMFR